MKNRINPIILLCGTIALLCLFSMFVPIVAPHYPATLYHPSNADSYTADYFFTGDYYQARQYWSIVKFALTNPGTLHRIVVSVSLALMLYWCTMSFMGESTVLGGLVAAIFNLGVVVYSVVKMVGMAGGVRPFVIGVVIVDSLVAVVCAVVEVMPGRRRYTKPMSVKRQG